MAEPMPPRAHHICLALLEAAGALRPAERLAWMRTKRVMEDWRFARQRQALWRALRAEQDDEGRTLYTQQRVAGWFGVTRSAIAEFEKSERDAAS